MANKNLAIGVVTYNRKDLFKECLDSIFSQTFKPDAIYIYDNCSTDGTSMFILNNYLIEKELKDEIWLNNTVQNINFNYKRAKENLGSSMGFYELSKKMYEDGFQYIMITDDDVVFHENYLKNIMDFIKNNNFKVVTSLMVENFNNFKVKGSSPIFAGGIISRDVYEKIGFPVSDYFIYWDDIDFVIRLNKFKFNIEICPNAFCIHDQSKFYKNFKRKEIKFLWYKKEYSNINDWKYYYAYRNMVITLINHKKFIDLITKVLRAIILAFIFLFVNEKKKFKLILIGLKDGFLNKRGKNLNIM